MASSYTKGAAVYTLKPEFVEHSDALADYARDLLRIVMEAHGEQPIDAFLGKSLDALTPPAPLTPERRAEVLSLMRSSVESEEHCFGCEVEGEVDCLFIYHEESVDLPLVVLVVRLLIAAFDPFKEKVFAFGAAYICSSPRPEEFGGEYVAFTKDTEIWGGTQRALERAVSTLALREDKDAEDLVADETSRTLHAFDALSEKLTSQELRAELEQLRKHHERVARQLAECIRRSPDLGFIALEQEPPF